MKDYEDVIVKMNGLVNEYHRMKALDGHLLNMLLKDISACLYYLETVRSDVHDTYQRYIKEAIENGSSAAKAEANAHVEYPAMYMLRRVMDGAYNVTDAIRSNISFIKYEMTNSQAA